MANTVTKGNKYYVNVVKTVAKGFGAALLFVTLLFKQFVNNN